MDNVPSTYQPLWERIQEEMTDGSRSYGKRNSEAYRAEFGHEYDGEIDGEIGAAALNLN